jgi:hypothetical protein
MKFRVKITAVTFGEGHAEVSFCINNSGLCGSTHVSKDEGLRLVRQVNKTTEVVI